jgi:small conductance mechanosensitive channel
MGGAITNYSVNDTRRVDLVFSVAYGTDAQKVIDVILDEAGKHEMVLKDPEAFCRLTKQNSSSLDFTLRVWVEKDNYWKVNFDLLEAVNARFIAEKIEIPFNQLDVHVKNS